MLHTITLSFFSVILLSSFALLFFFFFFNDTATTEIYTLSLHDALPISDSSRIGSPRGPFERRWLRSPAVRNDPAGHMGVPEGPALRCRPQTRVWLSSSCPPGTRLTATFASAALLPPMPTRSGLLRRYMN